MNRDFRVSVEFLDHPKTIKLERRLGPPGFKGLLWLWSWASRNRPDGDFSGMDIEDIELAAKWTGEENKFFETLVKLKWLDVKEDGGYVLHDWEEHNPWVAESDSRSEKSRLSRLAQVNKAAHTECQRLGITGLSQIEYQRWKNFTTASASDAHGKGQRIASAPPAPVPDPVPDPTPVVTTTICPEPQADSEQPHSMTSSQIPVITIPLKGKTVRDYAVYQKDIDEWSEAYPAVDILQALHSLRQWNLSNPTRQKTRRGIRQHITLWLDRDQNHGGNNKAGSNPNRSSPQPRTYSQAQDAERRQLARMILSKEGEHGKSNNGANGVIEAQFAFSATS